MIKIVADNKIPFLKGAFEKVARIEYLPGGKISREHLADADALIVRTRTRCNKDLLHNTPVKFIASATIGYDHIDTVYCDKNNIAWTNAPGCNSGSVKQYIASALAEIMLHDRKRFEDITIGIVGVGNVGSKIESLTSMLGMKTLINDPPRQKAEGHEKFTGLNELISSSDIITLHVPLTYEGENKTFHMADETFFSRMKNGAWFINTSRGEVADTFAITNTLRSKKISGVVLDVWENEPRIDETLAKMAFVATPHIAGYSADGKANGTAMSVRAVSRFFNLGLDDWFPESIPMPDDPLIKLSCEKLSKEELFYEVCKHTYDIMKDSQKLKDSLDTFEYQRESYPVRREHHSYKVKLENKCKTC